MSLHHFSHGCETDFLLKILRINHTAKLTILRNTPQFLLYNSKFNDEKYFVEWGIIVNFAVAKINTKPIF